MKKALELARKLIENVLDALVTIFGIVLFLISCVMYFKGYYQDCQCLMLILIFLFLKSWKDETLKNKIENK